MNPISTQLFYHFKPEKRLVAEISTLQIPGFKALATGKEAMGLQTVSHRTGHVSEWQLMNVIRDERENEITGWYLEPTADAVAEQPALRGYSMVIDND